MSILLMSRLFRAQLGSSSRKMMAVRLADFADDQGKGIWPTVARLSHETELSRSTVQRILKEFVDEGLLIIIREGGGGPGSATRYDFDITVLNRMCAAADEEKGCHSDTRSVVTPVASEDDKGVMVSAEGCHGDTRTVIEPLFKPLGESAPEREDSKFGSKAPIIQFEDWFGSWPSQASDSIEKARSAWMALTPADRLIAEGKTAAYLVAAKGGGRKAVVAADTYLRKRLWERVKAPVKVPAREKPAQPAALAKPNPNHGVLEPRKPSPPETEEQKAHRVALVAEMKKLAQAMAPPGRRNSIDPETQKAIDALKTTRPEPSKLAQTSIVRGVKR